METFKSDITRNDGLFKRTLEAERAKVKQEMQTRSARIRSLGECNYGAFVSRVFGVFVFVYSARCSTSCTVCVPLMIILDTHIIVHCISSFNSTPTKSFIYIVDLSNLYIYFLITHFNNYCINIQSQRNRSCWPKRRG